MSELDDRRVDQLVPALGGGTRRLGVCSPMVVLTK